MGLTDYISRNPHDAAKPIIMYAEDFVKVQIDAVVKTINAIRQSGRPQKFPNLESQDDSKPSNKTLIIISPRGRPTKLPRRFQNQCAIARQFQNQSA